MTYQVNSVGGKGKNDLDSKMEARVTVGRRHQINLTQL